MYKSTCNSREIFTSVDVSWPGTVHWCNWLVRETLCRTQNILADNGYGIEPWLMTPCNNPSDLQKSVIINYLTRERVIIERCSGQLNWRFSILKYVWRVKLENISKIVITRVIHHNIVKLLNNRKWNIVEGVGTQFHGNWNVNIKFWLLLYW